MRNILKTIVAIPIILLILSLICAIIVTVSIISWALACLYLPMKTFSYFEQLDEYKRIKQ